MSHLNWELGHEESIFEIVFNKNPLFGIPGKKNIVLTIKESHIL